MMIYEDGYPVSRLCANEGRNLTFKASKSLRIVLQTDNSRSFKGFKAIYRKGTFSYIPMLGAIVLHLIELNDSLFKFLVISWINTRTPSMQRNWRASYVASFRINDTFLLITF